MVRNLPPSVDDFEPPVISQPAGRAIPSVGNVVSVRTFCGVTIRARITEVAAAADDWIAWGEILPGEELKLRAAGVPADDGKALLRIFGWQVQSVSDR